ncbi:MAG: sensor domain-containing diguanylate cyclase [Burkholderiaceae bacterium]
MLRSIFRVDLRHLILWMSLFFVLLALGNGLHAAYQVQYGVLLDHNLETNRAYAEGLAQVTDSFLQSSTHVLEAAALDIMENNLDPTATQNELDQLASVTNAFVAVFAVDASGKIFAAQPQDGFKVGTSLASNQALRMFNGSGDIAVSSPFQGPKNRWLSLIARPLFSSEGQPAGLVGGVVHLENDSALQNALSKYHYQEGSYFYIIDSHGMVVYHPDRNLIGTWLNDSAPVKAALRGGVGTQQTGENTATDEIISFAPIPFANWVVISQRPTDVVLSPITNLFLQTAYYSLPLFIASLLAIWWSARLIAQPLHELADVAATMDNQANFSRIRFINGWYVEAALIQKGLMESFSVIDNRMRRLHREGSTDPLTGVVNRRGLDAAIDAMKEQVREVGVVMLDIDHFKAVNDNHGHAAGDDVLKSVTTLIRAEARRKDIVARMGGEEFAILLPDTGLESARHFAERLRARIEQTYMEGAGYVTASLGVACYPLHGVSIHDSLNQADAALYRAKDAGRNCICLA